MLGVGGEVMVAGVIWKDCQQPLDSEMINHFSTKEHKGRFVKKKQGTEYQLQGCGAPLCNNAFLKCVPHQKQKSHAAGGKSTEKAENKIFSKLEGMFRK